MRHKINSLNVKPAIKSRRGPGLFLTGLFALLVVMGAAVIQIYAESNAAAVPASVVSVAAIAPVAEAGFQLERQFVGRVEAMRASAVGFESGGLLAEVGFDEGQPVSAGTVLARLDTARLASQRVELAAAHKAAKARQDLASQTLKRIEEVIERGLASNQQLDEAREQFRSAGAEVELARARINSIDVAIAKSKLLAPFDAVITRRNMDEGRVVAAGEAVLELQELRDAEVRVGVAGPLVARLAQGQTYPLAVNGAAVNATVKAVLPVRGAATRTVDVIFSLDDTPDDIRDGDLVTLQLSETVLQEGYWLPLDALTEGIRGLWTAYSLVPVQGDPGATHQVVPHLVEILHTEADRIYVGGVLPEASLVVRTGLHKVVPEQRVRVDDASLRLARGGLDHATE